MKADIHAHLSAMLADYGVQYLFGMRIYEDLDTSRVRPINVHHETSAALMAYGYARVSGRPGVVTVNRAATPNVMMGLAEAHSSSVPVIVLLDGVPVAMEGKNAQFAQDQLGMLRPVTKWIGDATHLSMGPDMLAKAFRMATSGRPGPVVVSLRGAGTRVQPGARRRGGAGQRAGVGRISGPARPARPPVDRPSGRAPPGRRASVHHRGRRRHALPGLG